MADPEHLKILKSAAWKWNAWRVENPSVRPDLWDADLTGAELTGADLTRAGLTRADLTRADLVDAELTGADLTGAILTHADLTGADLTGAILTHADLTRAILTHADLTRAGLTGADLGEASLTGADLSEANLTEVNFTEANLTEVNLTEADLSGTDFSGADLSEAKLSEAKLFDTHFHRLDLSKARGLEDVVHEAPSPISSQTIEMSKGRLPDRFLKGCGLKDWEILAVKLHDHDLEPDQVIDITYRIADLRTHAPIAPLSVFVSYAHEDKGFAEIVERRLDQDGIRFWRDVHHMVAGPMERQIDRAISINGAVLLILSEASVESDWVRWEAEKARKLEQELKAEAGGEPRHRLCPVALDKSWETCDWPGRLRTQIEDYNILDFSMWKTDEDEFEAQYEKLKAGLGIYYRK